MEWRDDGIALAARRHGESALVVHALTAEHGRHAGLVPGGAARRRRADWETGNRIRCRWRGRLSGQLGTFSGEAVHAYAPALFGDAGRLAALSAACALCDALLPEREPHPALFRALGALLDTLESAEAGDIWAAAYVRWEVGLLAELGFALDLDRCAMTGARGDLRWVSPRTGRAASRAAGAPYARRLLPLPGFLVGAGAADAGAVSAGLRLTGHFLSRHAMASARPLPPARDRLAARFALRPNKA